MKAKLTFLILIMFCWSGFVWAQSSDEVQDKIDLINTLTQNGISFRYTKDAKLNFHSSEHNAMEDTERTLLPYLPETMTSRVATLGIKLENITIEITHLEQNFLLDNTTDERFGEFSADSIGFTVKKNITGYAASRNMYFALNFFAGLERTETYFKMAPTDDNGQELTFSNYGGTFGLELGFEIISGIFINGFIINNQQIYERGFYKGYEGVGWGIEILTTGDKKDE